MSRSKGSTNNSSCPVDAAAGTADSSKRDHAARQTLELSGGARTANRESSIFRQVPTWGSQDGAHRAREAIWLER